MKASYTLSQSLIAADSPSTVDLLITFQGSESSQQTSSRRPLNLSLVLDRSGSMAGSPLRYAIQAAQNLIDHLTPNDFVSVVIYDDTAEVIIPPQLVDDQAAIKTKIGKIRARGCTNLSGGWLLGCSQVQANQSPERINRVLLLTDGLANYGIKDPQVLTKTALEKAEADIVTTTLGFGNYFNEDLLINMANAARGNFYFIQSPDDASQVFEIEMESLVSVVAQNLRVRLQPEEFVKVGEILNNYRFSQVGNTVEVVLGDVYGVEQKPLAIPLTLSPRSQSGMTTIATVTYDYQTIVEGSIQDVSNQFSITLTVGSEAEAKNIQPDPQVLEQTSQLRIAKLKDEAVSLADKGDFQQAVVKLRETIEELKRKTLDEFFDIAEEIAQLDYYAQCLENRRFDRAIRKEMRDQSYQTQTRDREDLKFRGTTTGAASGLEVTTNPDSGVLVKCERVGGKLRVRVISEGYNPELNVQFPRSIRKQGVTYVVDEITPSANGTFYRTSGNIRRLVKPGEEKASTQKTRQAKQLQTAKAQGTAADLETTDTVGDGVLVQCIKDGKKLRARVVSDGYNPDYNIRFPRTIREEGMLYVVDEVKENPQGGSYIAYGKIRRLVQ
ncbi:VWA domain-containing protein [Coleofasciculus sp.]|uniref:VWA domain-containing protein n=1 Tax=Coleofasciculus sp. TaxID=3100458 RepID=UPI003A40E0B3